MGYHTRRIAKGVYGEFSKVEEEWEELLDARKQNARVLELCEITDLYGALKGYVEKRFSMTIEDVALMSKMTSDAFVEGTRTSAKPDVVPEAEHACVDCLLATKDFDDICVYVRADGKPYCTDCWFSKPENRSTGR